ncbi:sensor histidine kinase [Nocardioides nitrophenolicus]|uniref:sensor histidine kinase n=1 Tax=Nocardioides nitrophenolicus TaxID=60489 RepID=UPI00195C2747|nr:ATP-binding protein [Nocardioides nitrophenolicus]MBM7518391.1 signal transduction histidine kinase [Nocardioides nitrophenolicus]
MSASDVSRPVAAGLGVGQALVAAATLAVLLTTGDVADPPYQVRRELAPLDLIASLMYGPLGGLIVVRSRHAVGWAFLVIGGGYGATSAAIAWTVLCVDRPDLPGAGLAAPVLLTGWTTATLVSLLVLPFLLTPGPPVGWARRFAVLGALVVAGASGLRLLIQTEGAPPNPLTGGAVADFAYDADAALIPIYFLLGLAVVGWLGHRLRTGGPEQRRGLVWLLLALFAVAWAYMTFEIGVSLDGTWFVAGIVLLSLAEVMLLAAVFVLIRSQPSWRVDLAISRTLVGLLLTASLVAAYVLAVWALSMVLPWGAESTGLVAVAALALAVLPLRDWLQGQVERLVFGSGADPSALLERIAQAIDAGDPDSPQLSSLVEALRRALRLARVEVSLHQSTVASAGRRDADDDDRALHLDLHPRGRTVGVLSVVPPRGERLDPRTVRLLRQISGLVAVAAQLDDANRAVEEARARVVEVRQEERRLLRRELHDGLGPALSGTALALAAVPTTSALSDADAVLLGRLVEELSRRADDVRQMARVLLPPVLDEGRLGDALRLLAERYSMPRFSVTVDAPYADGLDGIHQIVVYQVAAEAVRNAARHAGARHCAVRLGLPATGGVRLEVSDDGHGIGDAAVPGVGMASMRERAAELGGTVEVHPGEERGTCVVMVLP